MKIESYMSRSLSVYTSKTQEQRQMRKGNKPALLTIYGVHCLICLIVLNTINSTYQ